MLTLVAQATLPHPLLSPSYTMLQCCRTHSHTFPSTTYETPVIAWIQQCVFPFEYSQLYGTSLLNRGGLRRIRDPDQCPHLHHMPLLREKPRLPKVQKVPALLLHLWPQESLTWGEWDRSGGEGGVRKHWDIFPGYHGAGMREGWICKGEKSGREKDWERVSKGPPSPPTASTNCSSTNRPTMPSAPCSSASMWGMAMPVGLGSIHSSSEFGAGPGITLICAQLEEGLQLVDASEGLDNSREWWSIHDSVSQVPGQVWHFHGLCQE